MTTLREFTINGLGFNAFCPKTDNFSCALENLTNNIKDIKVKGSTTFFVKVKMILLFYVDHKQQTCQ